MAEVEETMEQFQRYIQTQKEANQPLYKWAKYTGYRAISRAITGLDEAIAKFEAVVLPPRYIDMYLSRATQLSLSVSKIAVFAMGVMNEKSTNCIDEVEVSGLSAEGKANAQTLIISELKKLLKHCARATDRVYASLDLLRNALLVDYGEVRSNHTSVSWLRSIASLVLGAATSAAIGLATAYFSGTSGFNLALYETVGGSGCTSHVLNLVQRNQAITNLTGEIYSVKLQDLDNRYNQLKDVTESHGLRIDNLFEALGVPNEQGTYYTSSTSPPKEDDRVSVDVRPYIQKVASDANLEITRLHKELEQMRKNIHRMDIRLMKRLDKVDRYSS
jgi:TolA-binding protein